MLPSQDLKAVFFDLDNVLVFSEVIHFEAWQQIVSQYGIDPNALVFDELIGIDDFTQAQILIDQFKIDVDIVEFWELKRKTFLDLIKQGFEVPLGRNHFLSTIASRLTTGVVSSSGKHVIKQVLDMEKISSFFQFVIGHEDCSKHKPDPMPYLKALEQAKVQPHEALVIEDSPFGVRAALNAGIPVVGIFKDQKPHQLLDDVTYFNSFDEIHHWLYG